MPPAQQEMLQGIWRNIEARVPGTQFNFDFWSRCRPRRATYPACRAVVAATAQDLHKGEPMTAAIQQAYYLQARNPSDDDTLIELADGLELDVPRFRGDLNSSETRSELQRQIAFCRGMGIAGFPSLVLGGDKFARRLPVEFNNPELQLEIIRDAAGMAVP